MEENPARELNKIAWTRERVLTVVHHVEGRARLKGFRLLLRELLRTMRRELSVQEGRLFYREREIVPREEIEEVLQRLYDDPATSRNGRDSFYSHVAARFYGISRRRVASFLRNQENVQRHIRLPPAGIIAQPIVTSRPFSRWEADLIDMSELAYWNGGTNYLLLVIDCFSKRAYVVPLKNKEGGTVAEAMRRVLEAFPATPSILGTDRGKEFVSGEFEEVLAEHEVEHLMGKPYWPQSQGQVERFGSTLKRLLFSFMSKHRTRQYVDALPTLLENYHGTKHRTTGYPPLQLHRLDLDEEVRESVHHRLQEAADKLVERGPRLPDLEVGTTVHVSVLTTTEGRKAKAFAKSYHARWSEEIYMIRSVSEPAGMTGAQYRLEDEDGDLVPRRYYRRDLQPIDRDALVRSTQPRPRFPGTTFVREEHLATIPRGRREVELPRTALEERRLGAALRVRRPPRRPYEEEEEGEEPALSVSDGGEEEEDGDGSPSGIPQIEVVLTYRPELGYYT